MFLAKILIKTLVLAQYVIENPSCIVKRLRGIPLTMFHDLNQDWLKSMNIGTVIDVGANIGQFTKVIHEIFPDAGIYAFEPLKDCYEKLLAVKKSIPNFEAFNYAVGERSGFVEFHKSISTSSSSLLKMDQLHKKAFPHTAKEEITRVEMVKLDEMRNRLNIKGDLLLKIDVEGYEDKVLEGGRGILDITKILIIEISYQQLYEGQASFNDIYKRLTSCGFNYAGNLGELKSPLDGSILQTDSVFIRF